MGYGIVERILTGYKLISQSYEPGDEIYLFGFSRGAFEARTIGGIVALLGIVKSDLLPRVEDVWAYYQRHNTNPDNVELERLRDICHYPARIRLIGAWETVGNLGIPFAPRGWTDRLAFHSTELAASVDIGLHALAIDEPRGSFGPTFWTLKSGDKLSAGQMIEQVWFPGCHANIGGGYEDCSLSDISLRWMAERAATLTSLDVDLDRLARVTRPDPLGEAVLPTSEGLFRLTNFLPFIRVLNQDRACIPPLRRAVMGSAWTSMLPRGEVVVNESIHESAFRRFGKRVPRRFGNHVSEHDYRPRSLALALDKQR